MISIGTKSIKLQQVPSFDCEKFQLFKLLDSLMSLAYIIIQQTWL